MNRDTPQREVRASYTADTIFVYQAYGAPIALAALEAGRFVPPFRLSRMTWIKPSFPWMMYRSGWAGKPGQEYVLRIGIDRAGFDWALEHAVLSHFDPVIHDSRTTWDAQMRDAQVVVQWDPERDIALRPLPYRTIQIGLRGEAIRRYADEWVRSIEDVTSLVRSVRERVSADAFEEARQIVPAERVYPVTSPAAMRLGIE